MNKKQKILDRRKHISEIYQRIFIKESMRIQTTSTEDTKACEEISARIALSGVKWINSIPQDEMKNNYDTYIKVVRSILTSMLLLQPKKIAELFIPDKTYDGEKYGVKDYFFAKKEIIKMQRNGFRYKEERLVDYLTNLNNDELCLFVVNYMSLQRYEDDDIYYKEREQKIQRIFHQFRTIILLKKNGCSFLSKV